MESTDNLDKIKEMIRIFDIDTVSDYLRDRGSISYLCLDASSLKKVEIEYGRPIYLKIKTLLQSWLCLESGLKSGLGSEPTYIFKKSHDENIYFIIFNREESSNLDRLGETEKLCDHLSLDINNYMRRKIASNHENIIEDLGSSIIDLPYVSIAYCESLYNPGLDISEVIEKATRSAQMKTSLQSKRIKNLQKEFIHTLITKEDLLQPHFQAVIKLQELSDSVLSSFSTESKESRGTLSSLSDIIFGFEALIRINKTKLSDYVYPNQHIIAPEFLNPELLFFLAREVNSSLELDQICIKRIYEKGFSLPGYLMINILPRNLYKIEDINNYFVERCSKIGHISHERIIFEISESEAISNLSLMKESLGKLQALNIRIAADDFGHGFSGMEQLIQIQPNIIKLDKSLITDIQHSPLKQAYVEGILNVARITSIQVLAEGVECLDEAVTLKNMGIDLAQGFFFHKPESMGAIKSQLLKEPVAIEIAS